MQDFLNHPAVQAGIAPLVVALVVGALLSRTKFAWLAIIAGYATTIALSTGFAFTPLTVARKTLLLGLLAPLIGIVADFLPKGSRAVRILLAVAAGVVSCWVFASILQQREGIAKIIAAGGVLLFTAVLVAATVRHADDGLRAGAAGLGLGLAVGIAGVLSASIGALASGVSIAAASGALLLIQVIQSRALPAGYTGTLPIGLLCALVPAGTMFLAELPWYALPLLAIVPIVVGLPAPDRAPTIVRAAILAFYALVAAALPILAAWYAARGSLT
jgi:hypothetical protein